MPMLERTTASLEPCNFQRILTPSRISFTSRRRLRTAFWQHGAAEIELSNVWQTLSRECLGVLNTQFISQSLSQDAHRSSSNLALDFLWPQGTQGAVSLLRSLSPSAPAKYGQSRLYLRGSAPRLFTSSATLSQQNPSPATSEPNVVAFTSENAGAAAENSIEQEDDLHDDEPYDQDNSETGDMWPGQQEAEVPAESNVPAEVRLNETAYKFWKLIQRNRESDLEAVWLLYHQKDIPRGLRQRLRKHFFNFAMTYKPRSTLLALCLKFHSITTFHQMWNVLPSKMAPNFESLDRILSISEVMYGLKLLGRWRRSVLSSKSADQATLDTVDSIKENFLLPCVQHYGPICNPNDLIGFAHILKDHNIYEAAIMVASKDPAMRSAADRMFREYRQLPNVKVRGFVLHAMLRYVYYPTDDVAGLELVLENYYARFGRLDIGGYRRSLSFYARRGDLVAVKRLWDEYILHYDEQRKPRKPVPGKLIGDNPDFLVILHVHAVRGELSEVRRIFAEAQQSFGSELNIMCWNILLNAHAKAGEYDGAVSVFGVMKRAVRPDLYSYGTMMGMAGSRGDLEFTIELYRMAKNDGLTPNITMIDCVVEAYCQNDKLKDAESIVQMTTQKGQFTKAELATLWNSLLHHQSMRRELRAVNRLLGEMSKHGIPYNGETYTHLLRGLALCRQPHHALFLIQEAVKTKTWQPGFQHYTLLMTSFMKTGQLSEALKTSQIINRLGLPKSGQVFYKVLQALGQWATKLHRADAADEAKQVISKALRAFRKSIAADGKASKPLSQNGQVNTPWLSMAAEASNFKVRTAQASFLIFVFTHLREVATIPQILELWQASSPEASGSSEPPLKLLEALMLAAYHEKKYEEVEEIWKLIFDRVMQQSRVSAPGRTRAEPLPSTRYALNDSLKTMQRVYGAQNDPDKLRELITTVLRSGFRLDSKNWNYYIQFLVRMRRWREAFMVCEEHLMVSFHGWQRVRAKVANVPKRLPLDMRRRGQDPHYPRPISYTLMMLSKAYMDLENMAAWSAEAERLQVYIEAKCPSAIAAVKTQLRTYTDFEERLLSGNDAAAVVEGSDASLANANAAEQPEGQQQQEGDGGKDMPFAFRDMLQKIGVGNSRPTTEHVSDNPGGEDIGDISDWIDVSEGEEEDVGNASKEHEEEVKAWEAINPTDDESPSWRTLQAAETAVLKAVVSSEESLQSEEPLTHRPTTKRRKKSIRPRKLNVTEEGQHTSGKDNNE
ncbi:hypothetical protein BD289DRAFT_278452 [Coniella lustricola]|uniref:Pentacotripeptide-repeat region of PRORP domain-containing protein n=1 Tax=Coniella lustricola TaxID=2025994 RepID=A0A2T3A6C3_9PEZI|nr:hypothetical protein BD289DRAFT_278452 [Coniella lustricola]